MIELKRERIEQILNEETAKKKDPDDILHSVYTRYMFLYEKYLEDIDTLSDDRIAELRAYHEETISLVKFYKQTLDGFYDTMDYVFRQGFGTGSQTVKKVVSGLKGLIFGMEG